MHVRACMRARACIHVCVHVCACVCVCVCVCVCAFVRKYMRVCHVCASIIIWIHLYAYPCACVRPIYVCVRECVCVCVNARVCDLAEYETAHWFLVKAKI